MKRRSFRFRLALISMGLSGLVLLVFGLVAWWALTRDQVRAIDNELTNFGYRFVSRSGPKVSGERQEEALISRVGAEVAESRFFAIYQPRGEVVYRSAHWPSGLEPADFPAGDAPLEPQPELILPSGRPSEARPDRELRLVYAPRYYSVRVVGQRYRIGAFRNADVVFVSGADWHQAAQGVAQLRNAFLIALPAALSVIALGAWWLGRKALRPIRALERDMSQLSALELNQRLEAGEADMEFARIIETYNHMLERLERSFHQANRFSADASHELKTPLSIMRGTLERALNQCRTIEDAQEVFSDLLEQAGHHGAILESLLLLSRADAGKLDISAERINLSRLLETWLEDAGLFAEVKEITIFSEIEPGIEWEGDPILLQRVAHNLFSNAVRYNQVGGVLTARLFQSGSGIEWTVANTGASIPEADRERIFGRFVRSVFGPSQVDVGAGLGLSLVKEIVVAHGGTIAVIENAEGMTEFQIRFVG